MTSVMGGTYPGASTNTGPPLTFGYIAARARGRRSRLFRPPKATKALVNVAHYARHPGRRLRQAPVALSRESMPKQPVPLLGKQSTFQQTLQRVADRGLFARPVIATNDAYRFMAEQQAKDIGIEIDILVEPSRRDSGPAMAAAAAYARGLGAKAVLALASDHLVIGAEEFLRRLPRGPCRRGAGRHRHLRHPADGAQDRLRLYPPQQRADRPGAEGRGLRREAQRPDGACATSPRACCGTAATSLFPPDLLLSEMARFEPAMAAAAEEAVAKARRPAHGVPRCRCLRQGAGQVDRLRRNGAHRQALGRPARFRWSDLGTWDALLDVGDADSAGNVTEGPVEIDHVRNSYIRSDGPLTAVIGVEEVVVVSMNDAVLVGHRDNLPRLKDVVQRMSDGKHRAATEHAVMHRPWGSYQDIDRGERFRAKRLTVKPGGKLSLQSHNRRAEHWVVVKGVAEVTLDGKVVTLHENESTYIPIGGVHRLANPGKELLEVVEVQTGDYVEEDDIVRYEDIYARV